LDVIVLFDGVYNSFVSAVKVVTKSFDFVKNSTIKNSKTKKEN